MFNFWFYRIFDFCDQILQEIELVWSKRNQMQNKMSTSWIIHG